MLAHFEDLRFIRNLRSIEFRASTNGKELMVREAAKLLGVPESWIYAHTRQSSKDQIPHSRTERGTLTFPKDELLAYAKNRRHGVSAFLTTTNLEKELAARLGISVRRIYGFVAHPENYKNPLPVQIGDKLLTSIESLRLEFRKLGATAQGGRPGVLLPSEREDLPRKYHALKSDLHLMLGWAEREGDVITLEGLGRWICDESRAGNLRVLLFWPSLHAKLPTMCERVRNRVHGGSLGSAERAKELICDEYQISRPQLVKAINGVHSLPLAV